MTRDPIRAFWLAAATICFLAVACNGPTPTPPKVTPAAAPPATVPAVEPAVPKAEPGRPAQPDTKASEPGRKAEPEKSKDGFKTGEREIG